MMGFHPDMVSHPVALGHGGRDPVDVQAQEIEEFPAKDGDFRRIDAVRAEKGAAPALAALKEIVPPFLSTAS